VKTTPVTIYVDGYLVGSGSLAYDDKSSLSLVQLVARHCDGTSAYIGDTVVPVQLCWDDMVAGLFGGVSRRVLSIPVYLGDIAAGSAVVEVYDSYGFDLSSPILIAVSLVVAMSTIRLLARLTGKE
jgi:hypothetical protein